MPPALAIFRPRFPNKLGNGGGCIAQYDGCPCSCRVYVTYMNHRTRRVHRALLSVPTCGHDRTLILVIFQNTAVEGAQRAFVSGAYTFLARQRKSAEPSKTRLCAHSMYFRSVYCLGLFQIPNFSIAASVFSTLTFASCSLSRSARRTV